MGELSSGAEPADWSNIGPKQRITHQWSDTARGEKRFPVRDVLTNHKVTQRPTSLGASYTLRCISRISVPHQGQDVIWCGVPPMCGRPPTRPCRRDSAAAVRVFGVVLRPTQRPSRKFVVPHFFSSLRRITSQAQSNAAAR
jgi:hypothetical protein